MFSGDYEKKEKANPGRHAAASGPVRIRAITSKSRYVMQSSDPQNKVDLFSWSHPNSATSPVAATSHILLRET